MQSCVASNLIETVASNLSIVSAATPALFLEQVQSGCTNGVCSIDSGFAAMLRNSKGKLAVAAVKEARDFDFNSPSLV